MLHAFKTGTPPHGGIAWGLDRFVMLLQGEPNIREVIAFPKTGEGKDLMMNSPSENFLSIKNCFPFCKVILIPFACSSFGVCMSSYTFCLLGRPGGWA